MSSETLAESQVEIGHVLFIDIVGYSKRLVNEQTALVQRLNRLVRNSDQFQKADAAGNPITPTQRRCWRNSCKARVCSSAQVQ